jgi:ADP-ribosylglycohydrolase
MEAEVKMTSEEKLDKAYGCLIGLAIGDAFGDQGRSEDFHERFGFQLDLRVGGDWSTDDTEFMLLVAKELVDTGGELTHEVVSQAWLDHVVTEDYLNKGGPSERGAAYNVRRGLRPPHSGLENFAADSDGAAMRIAPVGVVYAGDPDKAAEVAKIDAEISHARDGIWSAQAIAASVAVAMAGASTDEIVSTGRSYIPDDSWMGRWFDHMMRIVADANGDIWSAWDALHVDLRAEYRASSPEAVNQTYGVFQLTGGSFRDGIVMGSNFGRDADTIGALIGAMAGAKHGAGAIPQHMDRKVPLSRGQLLELHEGHRYQGSCQTARVADEVATISHAGGAVELRITSSTLISGGRCSRRSPSDSSRIEAAISPSR